MLRKFLYLAFVNMHFAIAFLTIFNKFYDVRLFSSTFEKLIKRSGRMGWEASNNKLNLFEQ